MQYQDPSLTEEQALAAALEASRLDPGSRDDHRNSTSGAFPEQLGPFTLEATSFTREDLKYTLKKTVPESWTMAPHRLKGATRETVLSKIAVARVIGQFSPEHPVTLSSEDRRLAGIPQDAAFFCWSYPIDQDLLDGAGEVSADIAFLAFGGYVYFDSRHQLVGALALKPSDNGGLRFEAPLPWMAEMTKRVGFRRFKPVTIPMLRDAGVRYFCWIRPGEVPDAEHGAFAYLFQGKTRQTLYVGNDGDIYFPVAAGKAVDSPAPKRGSTYSTTQQKALRESQSDLAIDLAPEVLSPPQSSPNKKVNPQSPGARRRTPPPGNSTVSQATRRSTRGTLPHSPQTSPSKDFAPPPRRSVKSTTMGQGRSRISRTPPPQGSESSEISSPSQAVQRSRSSRPSTPPPASPPSGRTVRPSRVEMGSFPKHPKAPWNAQLMVSITPDQDPAVSGECNVLVSVEPPQGSATTKTHICCVIDISGSMGKEAVIAGSSGTAESHGLSLLDIAKHGVRTIMHTLGEEDWISVVSFNKQAHVASKPLRMNDKGRAAVERTLASMQAHGGTDLWEGLREGLNQLRSTSSLEAQGYFSHIMLLTDGVSKNSQSIIPNLKLDFRKPWRPCSINTFGFGYDLDSCLLCQLADLGHGSYAFIPDAGFVGTVFVNTLSNLLVTMGKHVSLYLKPGAGAEIIDAIGAEVHKAGDYSVVNVGNIQFGQSRDIVLRMKLGSGSGPYLKVGGCYCIAVADTHASYGLEETMARRESGMPEGTSEMVSKQLCRSILVSNLKKMIAHFLLLYCSWTCIARLKDLVRETIEAFQRSAAAQDEYIQALAEDVMGQVSEAVSREDWLARWGQHYLPSVMYAHLLQLCSNFKDAGVQHYGGTLFEQVRDQADDTFNSLPAPQPSIREAPPSIGASAAPRPAPIPVDMSAYNDRYSG